VRTFGVEEHKFVLENGMKGMALGCFIHGHDNNRLGAAPGSEWYIYDVGGAAVWSVTCFILKPNIMVFDSATLGPYFDDGTPHPDELNSLDSLFNQCKPLSSSLHRF